MAKKSKKIKPRKVSKLTATQKQILQQLLELNNKPATKKRKLSKQAASIYKLLNAQYAAPAKKRKVKPISKKARAIFNDLNKLYRQKPKPTGFAKNNFNYIRSLLWRTNKIDFKGYKDAGFIKIVNQLYNDCKPLGADCTDEAILQRYAKLKEQPRRPKPFIGQELQDPQNYFEIKDVPFTGLAPYLWVVSPMIIPAPHEFIVANYYYHYTKLLNSTKEDIVKFTNQLKTKTTLGNLAKKDEEELLRLANMPISIWTKQNHDIFLELYAKYNEDATHGYNTYFKEWVDWCNEALQEDSGGSPDSDKIFFRFTDAEYNEDKQRWETNLVICTVNGQLHDFGFKPTGKIQEHEVGQEYVEPSPVQLVQPTAAQAQQDEQELQKRRAEADLKNELAAIQDKLKQAEKKDKEQEIRIFLLEEERKAKEITRLSALATQVRKNINQLHKNLKLAQKMKDKKEEQKIYTQIKKSSAELEKINDQLIKLAK